MTTKQIKKLAMTSYQGQILDAKKVNRITKLLNNAQLKHYIRLLRSIEQAKKVKVIMSSVDIKGGLVGKLKKLFPAKKIEFFEDKSLIAGIKLVDNDTIYDFNLKNTFENLVSYINQ